MPKNKANTFGVCVIERNKVYFQKPDTHDQFHHKESRVHFRKNVKLCEKKIGFSSILPKQCYNLLTNMIFFKKIVATVKHMWLKPAERTCQLNGRDMQ